MALIPAWSIVIKPASAVADDRASIVPLTCFRADSPDGGVGAEENVLTTTGAEAVSISALALGCHAVKAVDPTTTPTANLTNLAYLVYISLNGPHHEEGAVYPCRFDIEWMRAGPLHRLRRVPRDRQGVTGEGIELRGDAVRDQFDHKFRDQNRYRSQKPKVPWDIGGVMALRVGIGQKSDRLAACVETRAIARPYPERHVDPRLQIAGAVQRR